MRYGIACLVAAALGAAPAHYEVVAEAPAVVALASPPALRETCGNAEAEGCTTMSLRRAECKCAASGGRWQMAIRVAFAPTMYVRRNGGRLLQHERLHVLDVHARMERWVAARAAARFDSEDACEQAGRAFHVAAVRALASFAAASQRELR